ncbi:hypothetical protein LSH36_142g06005 [Paralvinella palmiformis]|uniref:Uncharacterized protein n=1 Tax=Paralvinella palmiformis TaxID=53620 RepID=A0AAD9N7S3_9ANNE|nr:hypothetical protein LSH36_142g06005 [Paralvinella palmiformis]
MQSYNNHSRISTVSPKLDINRKLRADCHCGKIPECFSQKKMVIPNDVILYNHKYQKKKALLTGLWMEKKLGYSLKTILNHSHRAWCLLDDISRRKYISRSTCITN